MRHVARGMLVRDTERALEEQPLYGGTCLIRWYSVGPQARSKTMHGISERRAP